jgi:hypothetical protein
MCAAAAVLYAGCGSFQYTPPNDPPPLGSNSVVLDRSFDLAWARAIPQIGKSFFIINNIDKSSGLLNVSYSGDPEEFIDCGHIHESYGLQGADFPDARAEQTYMRGGIIGVVISRKLVLDGRANLVFERLAPTSTRVTVTARYVLTMDGTVSSSSVPTHETTAFSTGGKGSFGENGAVCVPNGDFERKILALVQGN